jgi:hypothetical protein
MCNPTDLDIVAQAVCIGLEAAGNNSYMRVLQCKTLNAFAPRCLVKSLDHIHICVLGCAFHIRWC